MTDYDDNYHDDIEPRTRDYDESEHYHESAYGDTSMQFAHMFARNGGYNMAAQYVQKAINARTKYGVQGVDALTIAKEALLRGDAITFEAMVHMANRKPFFTNPATYQATGVAL